MYYPHYTPGTSNLCADPFVTINCRGTVDLWFDFSEPEVIYLTDISIQSRADFFGMSGDEEEFKIYGTCLGCEEEIPLDKAMLANAKEILSIALEQDLHEEIYFDSIWENEFYEDNEVEFEPDLVDEQQAVEWGWLDA